MSEYGLELFAYFVFGSFLFGLFSTFYILFTLPFSTSIGVKAWICKITPGVLVLFNLLLFGAVVDFAWFILFQEKLYHMADPLFHFSPFVPFGWWSLDRSCGGHLMNGVEMWQLRSLWGLRAVPLWLISIKTSKLMRKRFTAEQVAPADASSGAR